MNDPVRELEEYAARWRADQPLPAVDWEQVTAPTGRRRKSWLVLAGTAVTSVLVVAAAVVGISQRHGAAPASPAGSALLNGSTTVVTLTAPRPLSAADRQAISSVLRDRLTLLGVTGSITVDDRHVSVSLPSADKDAAAAIGAQGDLQVRQVLAAADGAPPPNASQPANQVIARATDLEAAQRAFAGARCPGAQAAPPTDRSGAVPRDGYLVVCDQYGATKYLLGPTAVGNTEIAGAAPNRSPTRGQWLISLTLTHGGGTAWQQLSREAADQPQPPHCEPPNGCDAIAVLVNGQLLGAPADIAEHTTTSGTITMGPVHTRELARTLAVDVSKPLPLELQLSSIREGD